MTILIAFEGFFWHQIFFRSLTLGLLGRGLLGPGSLGSFAMGIRGERSLGLRGRFMVWFLHDCKAWPYCDPTNEDSGPDPFNLMFASPLHEVAVKKR